MQCQKYIYKSVRSAVFRPQDRLTMVLSLVYCPVDNTSFEVDPEIRCAGMSGRYCCYGNCAATVVQRTHLRRR